MLRQKNSENTSSNMAAKRPVRLTEEEVLTAILDSEDEYNEYSSLSENSESDDSTAEDFYDENGQAHSFDSLSLPTAKVQFVSDPCEIDSLLIGNVSIFFLHKLIQATFMING